MLESLFRCCKRWRKATLDVPYGPGKDEVFDFHPAEDPKGPLLAYVHGGAWSTGDEDAMDAERAKALIEAGINVASVDYDESPAPLTTMVNQVEKALAYLPTQAKKLGFDPRRIVLCGHSAGGHLATIVTIRESLSGKRLVKACCSISGVYDLGPTAEALPALKITPTEIATLSPLRLRPPSCAPLLLAVGEREDEVPFMEQYERMLTDWQSLGRPVEDLVIDNAHHDDTAPLLGDPNSELHKAVVRLCREKSAV